MFTIRCFLACFALFMASTPSFAQRSTPIQLLDPSGAAGDQFGNAMAADGDTMIVGAAVDDVGANVDQGAAHIYRWTGSGWTFEATLIAADGAAGDLFGGVVAISGDTVIVGARQDDLTANPDQGSAYIFVRSGATWTQQAKLVAVGGAQGDQFGISVALSGDTAIVGANLDDVGANSNQGSAYIFTRSGTSWTQQAHLNAGDGAASDFFGVSVAISGDTAIVGASVDDVGAVFNQGSAYIFVRSGTTWTQQAQLTAGDGASSDVFGRAVAISGDTALVGADLDDVGANIDQGSAYVFVRSGTTWSQQAKLTAGDGAEIDQFGRSLALSGDTAIVGALFDDVGANDFQGSAYVFERSGSTWAQQVQLTASDGATGDVFGASVAISGDTAVVGASLDNFSQGSAWVFSRVGSTWIGPDLQVLAADGAAADRFGHHVAVFEDHAIVGVPFDNVGVNFDQGSAYIFVRSGSNWVQQAQLTASDGAAGDAFGTSVAISDFGAIVGASLDDVDANLDQGSAYLFQRQGTFWNQFQRLDAADGAAGDSYGASVAMSGTTLMVGAPSDDVGANADQGSAYIYGLSGSFWALRAQLTASNGVAGDNFGFSVALSNEFAVVGAPQDDVSSSVDEGSVYVFVPSGTTWVQQSQLTASTGEQGDAIGHSVALSGNTIVAGAPLDDVGASTDQGSAHVFARPGTIWAQQGQLIDTDGEASDRFGSSVAVFADIALVGAWGDNVGTNSNQGSALVFTRSGTSWFRQARLTARDGANGDQFGWSVALSGNTAIVGASHDNVGSNSDQGSVWAFEVPADDFSVARNDVTSAGFASLASALLPALNGHQVTGTESAWRTSGNLDTAGRSLILLSRGDLRTPPTSTLTLGGSSSLNVPLGNVADIFGQLRVSSGASADVYADLFTLGSRGIMTARVNSSLTLNAPDARLNGQTRLEQGASLTFAGNVTAIGPLTAGLNASLTANGTFNNADIFTITAGTLNMPLFHNRAEANFFGSSAVFGDFTNEAGALATIRSGTLFVFGSLTNNGTIIGTICASCVGSPPSMDVAGNFAVGPASSLLLPFVDSFVYLGGDFDCAVNSNTRFDLSLATLQLEGGGPEQTLEVMSADIGPSASGLDRTIAGHYPIGILHIGPTPSTVRLVDARDNDTLGQVSCEAIYVDTLRIDPGSRLINTTCRIYYNTLINQGTIDVPGNVIQIAAACAADLSGSADPNDPSYGSPDGIVDSSDFFYYLDQFVAANAAVADLTGSADPNDPAYGIPDGLVDASDFFYYLDLFVVGCG